MYNNIYLFTGEERFLLYKELNRWKSVFSKKYWSENISVYQLWEHSYSDVRSWIFSWWLFSEKRLVVLFWAPKDSLNIVSSDTLDQLSNDLETNLSAISSDTILILVSFKPDKRTKLYKYLQKNINIKSFEKIKLPTIKKYVKEFFADYSVSSDFIDYFIYTVWRDLFLLENETNKVISYCKSKSIQPNKEIVDDLIFSFAKINPFDLLDKVFLDKKESIKIIDSLKKQWDEIFQLFWMLYWWLKVALNLIDEYESWNTDQKRIASNLWLHPFVVSKNLKIIQKLISKKEEIKKFYSSLIQLDFSIKSWNIPDYLFFLELKKIIYNTN